jgi:phosphoribosylanthranilate isomerase
MESFTAYFQPEKNLRYRIKICCIASPEEARMAIHAGADALGLVGRMPGGPGPIPDELIEEIGRHIHPPISAFLLTCEQSATDIIAHVKRVNIGTVQIVDELSSGTYKEIRKALPHLRIVQVIHVNGEQSIEDAMKIEKEVDAILLDSGNPKAAIKTLGGTGNTHDWQISRKLVETVSVPVFLAGGLNAGNVAAAIEMVNPFGVDVCSGVRTNGKLDESRLDAFIRAVHNI